MGGKKLNVLFINKAPEMNSAAIKELGKLCNVTCAGKLRKKSRLFGGNRPKKALKNLRTPL